MLKLKPGRRYLSTLFETELQQATYHRAATEEAFEPVVKNILLPDCFHLLMMKSLHNFFVGLESA